MTQIFLWFSFCLFAFSPKLKAENLHEIVVLNSYHADYKWTSDINSSITSYFKKEEQTRLFYDYMDSKHFTSEDYFHSLKETLRHKYTNHQIDGIICADNKAFDFFIEHGESIWGNVPAVFCGVNNIEDNLHLVDSTRHSIVLEKIDIKGTLDLILQLQPDVEEIIVVSDQTLSGKIFMQQFKNAIAEFKQGVPYREIDASNPAQLKSKLEALSPENKAIYLLSIYTSRNGISHEIMREKNYFFGECKIPMYSNWDFLMPDYIVGGMILKASDQGRLSAQLIQQKIKGRQTVFCTSPPQNKVFDYLKLQEYQIHLPASLSNVQIINTPISFVSQFKNELIFIFIILISLLIIIILLVSDVIKRKEVELDLLKSEKRLELAMDGAGEGLWDINLKNGSIFFNDQFARLLGYQYGKDIKVNINNWQNITFHQDIDHFKAAYLKHETEKTESFSCDIRLLKRNEQLSWFSIHGKITEWQGESPLRITGVIQNIDKQKQFENDLTIAKNKAEESDRLKSSFLANMSHEIRTPMNAILGFTDLLIENENNEQEKREYLSFVKRSGENLLTLLNDIIDISKIEAGQLQIKLSDFNLHSMLKDLEAVANSLITAHKKSIQFKLQAIDISHAFMIRSDKLRLYQILLNLISNAIKFTDEGYVAVNYKMVNDTNIVISVKDTGPGISEKHLPIIFDRFRQIDESTIKEHGGTGLGLSITKSLITLMNGSIDVKTQSGIGSEFKVSLPCYVTHHYN